MIFNISKTESSGGVEGHARRKVCGKDWAFPVGQASLHPARINHRASINPGPLDSVFHFQPLGGYHKTKHTPNMQLKIKLPGEFTLVNIDNAAPLITCLSTARSVRTEGWGDNTKYHEVKEAPTIEFVANDYALVPVPEPLVELQARLRDSEKRWVEYYNQANTFKRELEETKAELARIKETVKETVNS